jgi:hypothetical protein
MEVENRVLTVGILCFWIGFMLALWLNPRESSASLLVVVIAGLLVPIVLMYLSGKR